MPDHIHNKKLVPVAKMLRKNMTKEERHLWYDCLRLSRVRFYRQKVFGKYILDFYCPKLAWWWRWMEGRILNRRQLPMMQNGRLF